MFVLFAGLSASAAIIIDTVLVGNANNVADTTTYGAVSYEYNIGTYEVTNRQYTSFLNATATTTDPHGLYSESMTSRSDGGITRSGTDGTYSYSVKTDSGDKPVNFVNFWDAARFTNWLTNGQGDGATEVGVYDLTGGSNSSVTRNATAWANGGVAIASEDEWYKAAYYDGSNDSYYTYATQSDTISGNDANFDDTVGALTDVGAYSKGSYYGTYDQNGNVREWNESISSSKRGLRGGSYILRWFNLRSDNRDFGEANGGVSNIGFRVSSLTPVPEPSAYSAILGCLALALAVVRGTL